MIRKRTFNWTNDKGANLIEMALVTILLLLLLAGVADFGRAFYHYIIISNAAREGARYASHFPNDAGGIRVATKQEATDSGVTLLDTDILIDPDPDGAGPAGPGSPVRVSIVYDFPTILGGIIGADELTLSNSVEMVVFGGD